MKWTTFRRRHFQMYFHQWKCLNFIKISLKFVRKGPINNIPALVQIMAWRRSGDKPLSEPMMVSLPMHMCVTRPQWVNTVLNNSKIWNWNWNSKANLTYAPETMSTDGWTDWQGESSIPPPTPTSLGGGITMCILHMDNKILHIINLLLG